MKTSRTTRLLVTALVALLVAPSLASACPIAFRTMGPFRLDRVDLRRPAAARTTAAAWGLDQSWSSTVPQLNQVLIVRGGRPQVGVTFPAQRVLSIDAPAPSDNGWKYADDDDPDTPACGMVGKSEWQPPIIRVREGRQQIRVMAVAQRTAGDRVGCILGGEEAEWGCPTLTLSVIRLKRPVGARQLIFETFRR